MKKPKSDNDRSLYDPYKEEYLLFLAGGSQANSRGSK